MPCLADAIEQCQPCCLRQHPLVTVARLAAVTGMSIFGSSAVWGRWVVFSELAAGRVSMRCCCLARGVQGKAVTLLLQCMKLLSACCVCPSMLALPGQPFAWQPVSRGHGSRGSWRSTALGSSRSQQVLFPLAGVERSWSTCCLSLCTGLNNHWSFSALAQGWAMLCQGVTVVGRCFELCAGWLGLRGLLCSATAPVGPAALGWPMPELGQK